MHKVLVQMNLRLHQVVSDITGSSGISIILAIVEGESDPNQLARFRSRRLKKDEFEKIKALEGNYRPEHILSLKHTLNAYDFFHYQALDCEKAIEKTLNDWANKEQSGPPHEVIAEEAKSRSRKTAYNKTPYFSKLNNHLAKYCRWI